MVVVYLIINNWEHNHKLSQILPEHLFCFDSLALTIRISLMKASSLIELSDTRPSNAACSKHRSCNVFGLIKEVELLILTFDAKEFLISDDECNRIYDINIYEKKVKV